MTKLDADEAAARSKPTSLLDLWNSNKLAMTLAGVGAVAAVGFAAKIMAETAKGGGDEPPIRVKGGSLCLDLITNTDVWEDETGDKKTWGVKGHPNRSRDELAVFVDYTKGDPDFFRCSIVGIFHSSGLNLSITSAKHHIQVQRLDNGDPLQNYGQRLVFKGDGTLDSITVNPNGVMDVYPTGGRKLQSVLILDL